MSSWNDTPDPGWNDTRSGGWGDAKDTTWNEPMPSTDGAHGDPFSSPDAAHDFTNGVDDEFDNADPAQQISKHAGDPDDAEGGDCGPIICRNCDQPGHVARECDQPKKMTGECYNCGEVGHNKADCPNPKVERPFTGTCRYCHEEGHRAADCPQKPAEKCKNCLGEGHKAADCELARVIDRTGVPDITIEEAWKKLNIAALAKDTEDFKIGVQALAKADPELSYLDIEKQFREQNLGLYLVGVEGDCPISLTRVNLQGKKDCQFNIVYSFTGKARRKAFAVGWPESAEANIERLENAGEPMKQILPVCHRCQEIGHISKNCAQEKIVSEREAPKCENCGNEDHRLRDCPQERVVKARGGGGGSVECRKCNEMGHIAKYCPNAGSGDGGGACRNCGEEGHFARDCDKPRQSSGLACRNCGEEGHIAKECEKPRVMKCRNCDGEGHVARECPEPKDWSRVKCQNCGEMGHGKARCDKPRAENEGGMDGGFGDPGTFDTGNDNNEATSFEPANFAVEGNWNTTASAAEW